MDLNELIKKVEEHRLSPAGVIPYMGMAWRTVDDWADIPFSTYDNFAGITMNNKWDYPEWDVKGEQAQKLVDLITKAAQAVLALYEYIDELDPHKD